MATIQSLLNQAITKLSKTSDSAKLDCELLLAYVLNKSTTYLKTWPENTVNEEQTQLFQQLVSQRFAGKPIAHLLGYRGFWQFDLEVSNKTLIPRPDTEVIVEHALTLCQKQEANVLDLGTGTGAIALALAYEQPQWQVFGCDLFDDVVALAERNKQRLQLANCTIFQSNWYENVAKHCTQPLDLIISNPPYICETDPHLEQGDVIFEPKSALVAKEQGLADIKHIVQASKRFLAKGGYVVVEHGYNQAGAVQKIFNAENFVGISTIKDYGNNDRATFGKWMEK
ncbi:peptide chain release factor N(5)-glutamine methyltransferase [Flocculibacter collagenilyticus]|uniref:peptide chain release factor N(5)-glutamine methyltransferase n=1 Tax=Flocculibacter collagenilyticus TaxID=2744479 RepID=UPI0018F57258|nr:peptide chain release factor N(5)-glutamine methyltransferase [Flocculibacter collagenilyticus]